MTVCCRKLSFILYRKCFPNHSYRCELVSVLIHLKTVIYVIYKEQKNMIIVVVDKKILIWCKHSWRTWKDHQWISLDDVRFFLPELTNINLECRYVSFCKWNNTTVELFQETVMLIGTQIMWFDNVGLYSLTFIRISHN